MSTPTTPEQPTQTQPQPPKKSQHRVLKRVGALVAAGALIGLGVGATSAAGITSAQAATIATISVPNISITSMTPQNVWGTLTNPSVLGPYGDAQWNMQRGPNYSPVGLWYLYPGHAKDYAESFYPGMDPLGTYVATPAGATYTDANFNSQAVAQNTPTFYIREGSAAGIAVTRSGNYVTTQGYAKFYNCTLDYGTRGAWQVWKSHPVRIEQLRSGKWVGIKTMYTTSNGKTPVFRFVWSAKTSYRAVSGTTSTTWGATSPVATK